MPPQRFARSAPGRRHPEKPAPTPPAARADADAHEPPLATSRQALSHALFAERRGRRLGLSGVLLMLHQVCEALVPVLIGVTIDRAIAPSDPVALLWCLAALAVLFTVLTFSWRHGYRQCTRVFCFGEHALRQRVAARILHPLSTGRSFGAGRSLNIATSDASMTAGLAWVVTIQLAALAALLTAAVSLVMISWPLGLGVLVATPVFLWLLHLVTGPLERRTQEQQAVAAEATQIATDLVTGLRVLHGIGAIAPATERYRQASRDAVRAALRRAHSDALCSGVTLALSGIFLAGIAWVGSGLAVAGTITVGELVAVVGLAQFIAEPMTTVAHFAADLAEKRAAARRVADVVGAPHDREAATGHDAGASWPAEPRLRLAAGGGVDIDVRGGRIVGLNLDPEHAGVVVELLAGRRAPEPGELLVNGIDAATMGPDTLRGQVFVAEHDAAVFTGTVRDNLAAPAAVPRLVAAAGLDEVMEHLSDGLDSEVGEQGRSLSGGQRQRLLLGRALHQEQPLLVLHEPTTALDSVTESLIASSLRGTVRGGLLLLTTSPLLLGMCDEVLEGRPMARTGSGHAGR